MPDRAAIKFHITAVLIYNKRISRAYALHDFDSSITLGGRGQLYLTDNRQMQFTAIGLPYADASKYICGRQYSVLGGRGITATALPILGTITAPNIRIGFDNILLNTMALFLSVYDTDRREDGIAVI